MVQTIHPAWRNRSCLRFGIYSEALDDEQTNSTKAKNKRVRYGVVAGMILGATFLVSLLSVLMYDLMSLLGFMYILLSYSSLVMLLTKLRKDILSPSSSLEKVQL